MFERLTVHTPDNFGYAEYQLKRGIDDQDAIRRLAVYEDSGLSPEEVHELAKAKAEGRLVVLPCKVGDEIFSFRWSVKNEKYEVHTGKVKNVRYDSSDGLVMVSDGERYCVFGKTVFLTREAAEKVLGGNE